MVEWEQITQDLLHSAQLFALELISAGTSVTGPEPHLQESRLSSLLLEFADIFEEPRSLPPHRIHDHKIMLKGGTSLINVRPYRDPSLKKDVMEKTVQEMLEVGVVRASLSPYSFLIVLVKKRDGTWRLCVDYRQLNECTVLDKFSIPVNEELLGELFGAAYFSKIDLSLRLI